MLQVATSYSTHASGIRAAEEAAHKGLAKISNFKPSIALFFATLDYRLHYKAMAERIKEITGAAHVVGSSAHGVITEEVEIEKEPGVTLLLLQADDYAATSFLQCGLQESNMGAGLQIGRLLKKQHLPPELILLFPDCYSFVYHQFFDGLEAELGFLPILGGSASEDGREEKTYQIMPHKSAYDAVSGLALGGDFQLEHAVTRSCRPFGESMEITRADGHKIYEIDGRPAYDIFLEHLSQMQIEDPEKIFEHVFLGLPMRNFQTDFSDSPYLVRDIMSVNSKNGMLTCVTPVEEGEYVTFAMRDPKLAQMDLEKTLVDLRSRFTTYEPKVGFYFNCSARGKTLYGKSGEDIKLIRDFFPGVPILGNFTFSEFAPIDYVNHIHHHSGVLAFLAPKT